MPRELLLLRHGKSDWKSASDDYHRPLNDRGKRGAQRIGAWLARQALLPDCIVASPATRALVTAQKCAKAMGLGTQDIRRDQRIYLAAPHALLEVIADLPARARRVLLVGHNPGLEQILDYLSEAPLPLPDDGKLMPTATLARLAMPDEWHNLQAGKARLLQLTRASSLPEMFAYPLPDGPELRARPAYYYTQSSVIPYRRHGGRLEILLIRSSKNKHWVIPKGIADPGHSLQESAAREAWEEAGVEGEVHKTPVGSYSYPKWGATCTVTVYPMAVTRLLPEAEWQERHRGRQWVSPGQAATQLRQAELGPMVLALEQHLKGE